MRDFLKDVTKVGFDLDQTLYPDSPEIQERVRTEIAKRIVEVKTDLKIDQARDYFEQTYERLGSGSKVLKEIGYEHPERVMDGCLANADVLNLIKRNDKLSYIMKEAAKKYTLFLLTSSPQDLADKKLKRIGIPSDIFTYKLYSTTPNIGSKSSGEAFKFLLSLTRVKPEEHLYFGDRLTSDILPAKRLGMYTGTVWKDIPEADFFIPHINDLERILL